MGSFVYQRSSPRWKESLSNGFTNENGKNKLQKQTSLTALSALSREYGGAIISRDLAKEEILINTQLKNESILETTNSPDVKSLWGVKLRHVITKDNQATSSNSNEVESSFDFGISKLKRSENVVHSVDSVIDRDSFVKKSDFSHSLDYLCNELSEVNKNNINNNNKKILEFSSEIAKPEKKLNKIRSRSLLMRKISNQMFYQPVDAEQKPVLNLEELLKKDEQKLREDVYEGKTLNNSKSISTEEMMVNLPTINDNIISSPFTKEIIHAENKSSVLEKKMANSKFESSKNKDTLLNSQNYYVSLKDNSSIQTKQSGVKILGEVIMQNAPINSPQLQTEYFFHVNTNSIKSTENASPELKNGTVLNKLGQVIINDLVSKEKNISLLSDKVKETSQFQQKNGDTFNSSDSISESINNDHQLSDSIKLNNPDISDSGSYKKQDYSINEILPTDDKTDSPNISFDNNNNNDVVSTQFSSYSSLKILDSKISKSLEANLIKGKTTNLAVDHDNNIFEKENPLNHVSPILNKNLSQRPFLAFNLNQDNRRVSKLTIIPGADRDVQLEYGKYQIGFKRPNVDTNLQSNYKVLVFASNKLDGIDDEFSDAELLVPEVLYNGPVEQIKSILLTDNSSVQKTVSCFFSGLYNFFFFFKLTLFTFVCLFVC